MSGVSWAGFTSKPWDPAQISADNDAWRAEYLPRLRAISKELEAIRDAGRAAMEAIEPKHRDAIERAYGGAL